MQKDYTKSIQQLIDEIAKRNSFEPVDNPNGTGLSPDLTDEDVDELIKRQSNN